MALQDFPTLESVFKKYRFGATRTPFLCGRKAKTLKNLNGSEEIRRRVDGPLITLYGTDLESPINL